MAVKFFHFLAANFIFGKVGNWVMLVGGMGKRREARELAVQFLFQHDLNPLENLDEALAMFWESQRWLKWEKTHNKATWGQRAELPPPTVEEAAMWQFAEALIRGTLSHREECDAWIRKYAKNWELHRMAVVDRNVMRLAIYEMLHREDIPPVVSINEAVDIAKKFSTEESGRFVNGILDKVKSEVLRPAREAQDGGMMGRAKFGREEPS